MSLSPRVTRCPRCGTDTELAQRRDARRNWQIIDWCIPCDRRVGTHFIPRYLVSDDDRWGLYRAPDATPAEPEQCPICQHYLRSTISDAGDLPGRS